MPLENEELTEPAETTDEPATGGETEQPSSGGETAQTEPEINNAERLRAWLRACPAIASSKYFGADYIGDRATEYAVISVPSSRRYRENILGDRYLLSVQEQNFIFTARLPYGSDVQQNLANLDFFQDVDAWIQEQNAARNFPDWRDGTVTGIECSNTGAPVQTGSDAARYQFQLRVTYKIR